MAELRARDGTFVHVMGGGMTEAEADARYLPLAGGTMTGPLIVPDPVEDDEAANLDYLSSAFTGLIVLYAGATVPDGWLPCDGSAVLREQYSALFDRIGTMYGTGDGVTTFALPDLDGRLLVGLNEGDSDFNALGKTGGAASVTLSKSQVPNASGQFNMHDSANRTAVHTVSGVFTSSLNAPNHRVGYYNTGASSIIYSNLNLGFGGGSHENRMPSIVLQYIIGA
jgi:microcystin-dependent protein